MKPEICILLVVIKNDTFALININASFGLIMVDGARILELFENLESDLF